MPDPKQTLRTCAASDSGPTKPKGGHLPCETYSDAAGTVPIYLPFRQQCLDCYYL